MAQVEKRRLIVQSGSRIAALRPLLAAQSRALFPLMLATAAPVVVLMLGVTLAVALTEVSSSQLTRDPAAIGGMPFYAGALSQIGIVLWSATAAICGFAALAARRLNRDGGLVRFLWSSAVLTTLLLLDDLFQIHEEVLPTVVGVPEAVTYAAYAGLGAIYVAAFAQFILQTDVVVLGAALASFGFAVLVDLNEHRLNRLGVTIDTYLVESSAMLLGLVLWMLYFARVALSVLVRMAPRAA